MLVVIESSYYPLFASRLKSSIAVLIFYGFLFLIAHTVKVSFPTCSRQNWTGKKYFVIYVRRLIVSNSNFVSMNLVFSGFEACTRAAYITIFSPSKINSDSLDLYYLFPLIHQWR